MKIFYFLFIFGFSILLSIYAKEPDVEQIKGDLIGQHCKLGGSGYWTFESLSELDNFVILNRIKNNDILGYNIDMSLRDGSSIYNIIANVVYRKEGQDWKLVSVKGKRK